MATVVGDTIDMHEVTVSADRGWEMTRMAIVTGLSGSGYQRVISAMIDAGIPNIGDVISGLNYPYMILRSIRGVPLTNGDVKLTLYYSERATVEPVTGEAAQISVGSMVSQIETNKDAADADISVEYTYPEGYTKRTEWAELTHTQGGMVSKLVPQRTYTVVKRFAYTTADNVETIDDTYTGKVNSDTWRGYSAKTWLCTGIQGQSNDGQQTYVVTATFQYNPDTWTSKVVFIDPNDGKPPADLDTDGQKDIELYETVAFSGINTIFGIS